MRIAICDDEDQERLNIEALVKRYAPELSIVLFSSADELLAAAKTTFFPLIFLDIEMDDTNGFDAAEELMSGSAKPLIVFVTKSTEYTIRGYDVAFHYLVKPLNEAKFHEVLKRALRLIIPQYFTFSSNGELYRIPVQEILYFESRNYIFINLERQLVITDNVVRLLIGHANTFFQLVIVDGRRKPRTGLLNFAALMPLFDVNSHL